VPGGRTPGKRRPPCCHCCRLRCSWSLTPFDSAAMSPTLSYLNVSIQSYHIKVMIHLILDIKRPATVSGRSLPLRAWERGRERVMRLCTDLECHTRARQAARRREGSV